MKIKKIDRNDLIHAIVKALLFFFHRTGEKELTWEASNDGKTMRIFASWK